MSDELKGGVMRPWAARAEELKEDHPVYYEFWAWREWIMPRLPASVRQEWDVDDGAEEEDALYSICCELADGKAGQPPQYQQDFIDGTDDRRQDNA